MYHPLVAGSKDCKIDSVDVSNCAADAQSCDFPRGQTINMTMKFTPSISLWYSSKRTVLTCTMLRDYFND